MSTKNNCDNELIEIALKKDKLIAFVGAGVSHATGIPLWNELLLALEKKTGKNILPKDSKNKVTEDFAIAAQKIYDEFVVKYGKDDGNNKYYQALDDCLKTTHWDYGPSQINIIHTFNHIVTINFDKTFDEAIEDYEIFTGRKLNYISQVLQNLESHDFDKLQYGIAYLHGRKSEHVIFKTDDYKKYYSDNTSQLLKFYNYLYAQRNMVFIGVSFEDSYLKSALKKIYKECQQQDETEKDTPKYKPLLKYIQHYAFVENKEEQLTKIITDLRADHSRDPKEIKDDIDRYEQEIQKYKDLENELKDIHIKVLPYDHHKDYREWLNNIKELAKNSPTKPTSINHTWEPENG